MTEVSGDKLKNINGLAMVFLNRKLHFLSDRAERIMASNGWPALVEREGIKMSRGGGLFALPLRLPPEYFGLPEEHAGNRDLIEKLEVGMGLEAAIVNLDDVWTLVIHRSAKTPNSY